MIKGEDYEGELPTTAKVVVMNTVSSALVGLETGDVQKYPYGIEQNIQARQIGEGRYSAIIVPQKILNQVPLVEITINDISYLISTRFIFESGKRHTIDITLNSDPNKALINIGGGIESWN